MSAARSAAVFVGPMGSGKTRVGSRVARELGVDFIDTDKVFVSRHGPIADYFTERGEPAFRALEREIVAESLGQGAVVSLGGGAVLDTATRALLADERVVYLTVSAEAVQHRIVRSDRPLLRDGPDAWERIMAARRPLYESVATARFDTSSGPFSTLVSEIASWIRDEQRAAGEPGTEQRRDGDQPAIRDQAQARRQQ